MELIIEGERLYLRPLQQSNFEDFCAWFGDDQVTRFVTGHSLSRDEARTLFNRFLNDLNGVYFAIIKKDEERTIGYIFLADILKSHKVALEFGIVIGDKNLWGHGYGSEATKLLLEYGFKRLNLHRIQLLVLDLNTRARKMYRKLGFVEEGIQREGRLIDGNWHDVVLMGMLEKEYQR